MTLSHTERRPGPRPAPVPVARGIRRVAAAWLFVAGIGLQVFLAGLGVLVNGDYLDLHRGFSHLLFLLPPVVLVAGLAERLPRQRLALTAALIPLLIVQYTLVYVPADGDLAALRALHLVNALALFWVALQVARP